MKTEITNKEIRINDTPMILLKLKRDLLAKDASKVMEECTCGSVKEAIKNWLENKDDIEASKVYGEYLVHALKGSIDYHEERKDNHEYLDDYKRLLNKSNLFIKPQFNEFADQTLKLNMITDLRRAILAWEVRNVMEKSTCGWIKETAQDWLNVWDDVEGSKIAGAEFIRALRGSIDYHEEKQDGHPFVKDYERLLKYRHLYMKKVLNENEEFTRAMNLATDLRRFILVADVKDVNERCTCGHVKHAAEKWLETWDDVNESKVTGGLFIKALQESIDYHVEAKDNDPFVPEYERLLTYRYLFVKKVIDENEEFTRAMNLATDLRRLILVADVKDVNERCTCGHVKEAAEKWLETWDDVNESKVTGGLFIKALQESIDYHVEAKDNDPFVPEYERLLTYRRLYVKKTIDFNEEYVRALNLVTDLEREIVKADVKYVADECTCGSVKEAAKAWLETADDAVASKETGGLLIKALKGSIDYHVEKEDNHPYLEDYERLLTYRNLYVKKHCNDYTKEKPLSISELREAIKTDAKSIRMRTSCGAVRKAVDKWLPVADDAVRSIEPSEGLKNTLMGGLQYHYVNQDNHPYNDEYERLQAYRRLFVKKNDFAYMQEMARDLERGLLAVDAIDIMNKCGCGHVGKGVIAWIKTYFDSKKSYEGAKVFVKHIQESLDYHVEKQDDHAYCDDYRRLLKAKEILPLTPYLNNIPVGTSIDEIVRFRRALMTADFRDISIRTTCGAMKKAAEVYLPVWNDAGLSKEGANKLSSTLVGGLQYHYVNQDGHPFNDDYERINSYFDLFEKKSAFAYMQDIAQLLERGLLGAYALNIMEVCGCGHIGEGVMAWVQTWDDIDKNIEGNKKFIKYVQESLDYHVEAKDGHAYMGDYQRMIDNEDAYLFTPLADQGNKGYGVSSIIKYRRALMTADFRDISIRTTCGAMKKAAEVYLPVWNDKKASIEASEKLKNTLMGGLQYHYVNQDGHPFNDDYERIQAYRDLFEMKSDYEYIEDLNEILRRGLLGAEAIGVMNVCGCGHMKDAVMAWVRTWDDEEANVEGTKTLIQFTEESLDYHVKAKDDHQYKDDYRRMIANRGKYLKGNIKKEESDNLFMDFRRALIAADFRDISIRTTCGAMKKAASAYLPVWDDTQASIAGAEKLHSTLVGGSQYHYVNRDNHQFLNDYERINGYTDLFIKKDYCSYNKQFAQDLKRGVIAMDAIEIESVCGCGHIKEGLEAWFESYDDFEETKAGSEKFARFIKESYDYHDNAQDGHPYQEDYLRLLSNKEFFEKQVISSVCDDSELINSWYDSNRSMIAADAWFVSKWTSCGAIKKAVKAFLDSWLDKEKSTEGAIKLKDTLKGAVAYHYIVLDSHPYKGDYERLQKWVELFELKDVKDFISCMEEKISKF